jgi:NAD(P)-dependent dehydrogenase (short-subunit alcohol dehydrogenase family)
MEQFAQLNLRTRVFKALARSAGAAAILWLSSTEAGYITGQQIIIDGGNSIAEERAT